MEVDAQEKQALPQRDTTGDTFTADVANAVCDYCADGLDAFESCLAQAPALEPCVLEEIRKGSNLLYNSLLGKVETGMKLFEQLCQSTVFHVPMHNPISVEGIHAVVSAPPAGAEAELDAKLAALRAELQQVSSECEELNAEIARLDQDMSKNGDMGPHQALASAASASKEGSQEYVRAIIDAAAKLQPLLVRAAALRAAREPLAVRNEVPVAADWRNAKAVGDLQSLQLLNNVLGVQRP